MMRQKLTSFIGCLACFSLLTLSTLKLALAIPSQAPQTGKESTDFDLKLSATPFYEGERLSIELSTSEPSKPHYLYYSLTPPPQINPKNNLLGSNSPVVSGTIPLPAPTRGNVIDFSFNAPLDEVQGYELFLQGGLKHPHLGFLTSNGVERTAARNPYNPPWAKIAPLEVITLDYDPTLTPEENGLELHRKMVFLDPGQMLVIGDGTWVLENKMNLSLSGTAQAPIWIVAAPGANPIITRPNALENLINVGDGRWSQYFAFRGIRFKGGDTAIKLYLARHIWIDNCEIYDTSDVALAANTRNNHHLYITRNEIHHTDGFGEAIYLGDHDGSPISHSNIIALNHIHHTGGHQGDGIEIKPGSYNNWIVGNLIHDTNNPCIVTYGTDGEARNIIERNVCYNVLDDNGIQVQGDAIVRNNFVMSAYHNAFHSHDHVGQSNNLTVVHNTFINTGDAANLVNWNGRQNMVFANNIVYSESGLSMNFRNGSSGVTVAGNVILGPTNNISTGFIEGNGFSDFENFSWNLSQMSAQPAQDSAFIGAASEQFKQEYDLTGKNRISEVDAGCYDNL